MYDLTKLPVEPAGFGKCRVCPYYETGPAALCFACARQSIQPLSKSRCTTCDRPYAPNETKCQNFICQWEHGRYFLWNFAIAMKSGFLEYAIRQYKFRDQKYWAIIFARVIVGFLEGKSDMFEPFDLIVGSPTFLGDGGRTWDHIRLVLEKAQDESGGKWPFDIGYPQPAIIKTATTPSMTGKNWQQRHAIAKNQLRNALAIPDRQRTRGKNVLVYDDVFTNGHTLKEIARCLIREGGANDVCGITLARAPWRG